MKRPQIKHPNKNPNKNPSIGGQYSTLGNEAIAAEENQINRLARQLDKKDAEKKDLESELLEVYRALFAAPENPY